MKKIILALCMVLAAFSPKAQDQKLKVFSDSYTYEYNKNYQKAIEVLEKAYVANWYEINLRLGWLHYLNGDNSKSQNYYKKAVALKPLSIEAKLGMAYPLSALGNWNEVEALYKEILKTDPRNTIVNYRMALINQNRKKSAQALEFVKKVTENYPFDYDANLLLGKIQISLGNLNEAKAALNTALYFDPTAKEPAELLKNL